MSSLSRRALLCGAGVAVLTSSLSKAGNSAGYLARTIEEYGEPGLLISGAGIPEGTRIFGFDPGTSDRSLLVELRFVEGLSRHYQMLRDNRWHEYWTVIDNGDGTASEKLALGKPIARSAPLQVDREMEGRV